MDLIAPASNASSTASAAAAGGSSTERQLSLIEEGQDRFIKLLVAQLKNQDPLSPLDNAQFTTQLAQISTVQGIEKLNTAMSGILDAINAGAQLQAVGLVGKQALFAGNTLQNTDSGAPGGFELAAAADSVTVTITDAAGAVVRVLDLGRQPAGVSTFAWDGKNAAGAQQRAGEYAFSVEATSGGVPVAAQPLASARISAVSTGKEGVTLSIAGATYQLGDIRQIN